MKRLRYFSALMLGMVLLLMITCRSSPTPEQSESSATGPQTADGSNLSSSSQLAGHVTNASYSRGVRPVASRRTKTKARRIDATGGTEKRSGSAAVQAIQPRTGIVVGGLPVVCMGVLGLVGTSLDGRGRRLIRPSSRARR
jgi:hypothetical protein